MTKLWRLPCLASILALYLSAPALAEFEAEIHALSLLEGTIGVSAQPIMYDGRLGGCTVVFDVIHRDWTYKQGAFVKVTGNFGIMGVGRDGGIGAVLKVVVQDDLPTLTMKPATAPTRSYLYGEGYQTSLDSLIQAGPSDIEGALFSVFQLSPSFEMMADAFDKNEIRVAFNMGGGSTDIILPIELDVTDVDASGVRERSSKPALEFFECAQAMVSAQ